MSHNIMENDIQIGTSLAWHGLTKVVKKIDLKKVEIRYPMETRPLFCEIDGKKIETGFQQIVALDRNIAVGNPVGSKYCLLSNEQVLDMTHEALSGFKHEVVSVGTVQNRALVFVSVSLKDNPVITAGNRETKNVLNIMFGHGGSMPVIAKSGFTVVVCNNTFDMAMSESSDFKFKLKHCKNAMDKLDGMAEAVEKHYGIVGEFKAAMDSLAATPCDETRANRIVVGMLGDGKEVSTRSMNNADRIVQLFKGSAGCNGRDMCDLFNGITNFYTHESSSTENTYKQYVSSEFGAAGKAKREAFSILTDDTKLREVEARGAKSLELTMAN